MPAKKNIFIWRTQILVQRIHERKENSQKYLCLFVCAKEKIIFLCFVDQFVTYRIQTINKIYANATKSRIAQPPSVSLKENALFELARL